MSIPYCSLELLGAKHKIKKHIYLISVYLGEARVKVPHWFATVKSECLLKRQSHETEEKL